MISFESIKRIKAGTSNVWLIKNGQNSILIDAGNKNKSSKVLRFLEIQNVDPSHIRYIIITHTHYDHCGGLDVIKKATGAEVIVHKSEANRLKSGYCRLPDGIMWFSRILNQIGKRLPQHFFSYKGILPDIEICEEQSFQLDSIELSIIHTPGHTKGSISIILDDKYLFVGDTLFNIFKRSVMPPYANHLYNLMKSWKKLETISAEYIFPGHGACFINEKFTICFNRQKEIGIM